MSDTSPEELDKIKQNNLIVEQLQLKMMQATGTNRRGQHFKQHGCVEAVFSVADDLPEQLKVGLFAKAADYQAYIRFSNGGKLDDNQPDIHGMAIKLLEVHGDKILAGEESATTHDFVLADNPVFFIRTADEYAIFIEDFATSSAQNKPPLKFIAWLLENYPADVKVFKEFSQHKLDTPLTGSYWSQLPYFFGREKQKLCRYSVTPGEANHPGDIEGDARDENYLRTELVTGLSDGRVASFDFHVQLNENTDYDIVNNPTIQWDTPIYKVATITIGTQEFNTPERDKFSENLSFTPWHALSEHCPAGEVNDIRKQVYIASSTLRHKTNGIIRSEP
ncbi:MAG: catalase [Arenicella sp.]|jgi:catalase